MTPVNLLTVEMNNIVKNELIVHHDTIINFVSPPDFTILWLVVTDYQNVKNVFKFMYNGSVV